MPVPTSVLIVDDEETIRQFVRIALEREGMSVLEAYDRAGLEQALEGGDVDLVLLDVRLPDADGFDILRDVRGRSDVPIIMLTGMDTPTDRVLGLEFGADDYLGKPFDPKELAARIRNVMRRRQRSNTVVEEDEKAPVFQFGAFRLDSLRRSLTKQETQVIPLTSAEFDLLLALVKAARRPLSRDQLLDQTQQRDWTPYDRSVDVLIGRIRKKIEDDPRNPTFIKTLRGVGYVFAEDVRLSKM
jgi:DNA-binding response OmpR family regulator